MKTKTTITILGILLIGIAFLGSVSAYKLVCLTYGQILPPESSHPRKTCWHDQCTNICTDDNYYPTNPDYCYGMSGCESVGDFEPDLTAPNLTVNSPTDGDYFGSRSVLFDLEFDEPSSIYWIDNINGRGLWKKICSNCDNSYLRSLSFKDGFNNITIMAKDRNDNNVTEIVSFTVDSKKPKIKGTEPRRGFASGEFEVQYSEENPASMVLHYGNEGDYREEVLDLEDDCWEEKRKQYCKTDVELGDYDEEEIEYWFELRDIAGSVAESKHVWIEVDNTDPVIVNSEDFWEQGEGRYAKYIYFDIEIDEKNFMKLVIDMLILVERRDIKDCAVN